MGEVDIYIYTKRSQQELVETQTDHTRPQIGNAINNTKLIPQSLYVNIDVYRLGAAKRHIHKPHYKTH